MMHFLGSNCKTSLEMEREGYGQSFPPHGDGWGILIYYDYDTPLPWMK
jgi:predicted glutamine amidotransferase